MLSNKESAASSLFSLVVRPLTSTTSGCGGFCIMVAVIGPFFDEGVSGIICLLRDRDDRVEIGADVAPRGTDVAPRGTDVAPRGTFDCVVARVKLVSPKEVSDNLPNCADGTRVSDVSVVKILFCVGICDGI